jgi:hypothetical protein
LVDFRESALVRTLSIITCMALIATLVPVQATLEAQAKATAQQRLPVLKRLGAPDLDIARFRTSVAALESSGNESLKRRGKRLSTWLAVASAANANERRAAISKLNVSTVLSRPGDGRDGYLKTFIAGGKARVQHFLMPSAPGIQLAPGQTAGGPSENAPVLVGRWKVGDSGGCYWDGEDTGSDQCSPVTGRWKVDGDACYFDDQDSGSNQCSPATGQWEVVGINCEWNHSGTGDDECEPPGTDCYSDGAIDTCATQQEIDDALALVAAAEYELEFMAQQLAEDFDSYCTNNPTHCFDITPPGGPVAPSLNCVAHAVAASAEFVIGGGLLAGAAKFLRLGRVGVLTATIMGGSGAIVVGVAAATAVVAWNCFYPEEPLPAIQPNYFIAESKLQ